MKHVDDFIDHPPEDEASRYAAFCFLLFRLPATMKFAFRTWTDQYKLFCTYHEERYRVVGASRLGDVWLNKDFDEDTAYHLRVAVDDCTEWKDKP